MNEAAIGVTEVDRNPADRDRRGRGNGFLQPLLDCRKIADPLCSRQFPPMGSVAVSVSYVDFVAEHAVNLIKPLPTLKSELLREFSNTTWRFAM